MIKRASIGQLFRYGLVGLGSNALLYVAYLFLAGLGMDPKVAMTITYCAGVLLTFAFNRTWSFRHQGRMQGAFVRYLLSYAFGYLLNLAVLWVAVGLLGWHHQLVQGVMILTLAVFLFILQKYWVFSNSRPTGYQSPVQS